MCTKTLYNYVEIGLLKKIKNIYLPVKVRRKNHKKRIREYKKKFGTSIEKRPESVNTREEFGHWECDLVVGKHSITDNCRTQNKIFDNNEVAEQGLPFCDEGF